MTQPPEQQPISKMIYVVILFSLAELYCQFPFEEKGTFAEIGRFVLNAAGSLIFIVKGLLIAFLLRKFWSAGPAGARNKRFLIIGLLTPLLTLALHVIAHPEVAIKRTIDGYVAGPVCIALLIGAHRQP